jgi:hypothetical protein
LKGGEEQMVKKITFIYLFTFTLYPLININSQPWEYNFGTDTATYNTAGQSTSFLPAPEDGISLVAISSGGGGSFHLENLEPFGNDVYLKMVAANTTDPSTTNKFSIVDINDDSSLFAIRFDIMFRGNSGLFQFFNGFNFGGNSQTFTGTTSATNSQIFSGIRWQLGSSPDTIITEVRTGNWNPLNPLVSDFSFKKDLIYTIDIYSNNSETTQSYTFNGPQNVAPNRWDLWVNGVMIRNELTKPGGGNPGIADGSAINSFTFIGANSTNNSDFVYIDNIFYTNIIPQEPLPVELISLLPDKFILTQNYPNPFNPSTKIEFSVPYTSKVRIDVYDILGQHIKTLINEELERGYYNVAFDALDLPAGTYIYRIIADNFSQAKKMMLLK